MTIHELHDPKVWEEAWATDPSTFANRTKEAGIDPARTFDHKAAAFNEQVFSNEGVRRTKRILGWLEDQGVSFEGASVLDVGAASGGFSIPMAECGAEVTAVEPNGPLAELFQTNLTRLGPSAGSVRLVRGTFEEIDRDAAGWRNAFDLVFASMCPAVADWQSVENLIGCARRFCYISLSAGRQEHSLLEEVMSLVAGRGSDHTQSEMAYLLQLLYLKGYSFASLITKELKTTEPSAEEALDEVMELLRHRRLPADEKARSMVREYLSRAYPEGRVTIRQGGRFGKVLIQLQDLQMYSRR